MKKFFVGEPSKLRAEEKLKLMSNPETAIVADEEMSSISSGVDLNDVVYSCKICNKSFGTEKSLHGHMRCHPDRPWRGMQPPKNLMKRLLKGWPAEVRRGRTTLRIEEEDEDDEEEELIKGAAYALVMLSKHVEKEPGIRVSEILPPNKKLKVCGSDEDSKIDQKVEMVIYMDADNNNNHCSSSTVGKKRKRKNQAMQFKMKSYTCSICSKCFSTPQALGGHTSSAHNKILIKNMASERELKVEDEVVMDETCQVTVHVCKICDKPFPSGQALGGHKRLHYQPPVADVVAEVIAEAQGRGREEEVARNHGGFRCFDLNEIPADDCWLGYGSY